MAQAARQSMASVLGEGSRFCGNDRDGRDAGGEQSVRSA